MPNRYGLIFLFKLSIMFENPENSIYIYFIKMKVCGFIAAKFLTG